MRDDELKASLADAVAAPETVARLLDEVAQAAEGLWDIDSAMRALIEQAHAGVVATDAPGVLLLRSALDAVTYRLSFDHGRCIFLPYLELADGVTQPTKVEMQPDDVIDRWRALGHLTTHSVWRSRFGHLLVASDRLVGKERTGVASAVIGDYLALAANWGRGLDSLDALRAALALAKTFGLRDARDRVFAALMGAVRTALAEESPKAGIVLGSTQTLVDERDAPDEVDALLAEARAKYAGDPHLTDEVIEQQLARARGDEARRGGLWRERVQTWLDAAAATGDVRRAKFLETAVEHASASGDKELRKTATARLQELTLDDLKLQGMRSGMVLRGEDIAQAVLPVTDAPTWEDAMGRDLPQPQQS